MLTSFILSPLLFSNHSGNCCCYNSCNCNFPACIGGYCKYASFWCQEDECICYKPMCCERQKFNKDTCCIWFHRHYVCVTPQTWYVTFASCVMFTSYGII